MPQNNSHGGGSTPADGRDQDRSDAMSDHDKDRRKSQGHGGKSGSDEEQRGGARARNEPPDDQSGGKTE